MNPSNHITPADAGIAAVKAEDAARRTGATTPVLTVAAGAVYRRVLDAMQRAEELGGPEGAAYVDLMTAIAAEAQARVATFVTWKLRELDEAEADARCLKRVGDALGTDEGDEALVEVARNANAAEQKLAALERGLAASELGVDADGLISAIDEGRVDVVGARCRAHGVVDCKEEGC